MEALVPAIALLADDDAAAADVDAERATALAHSVLFSDYLWRLQLWRWLDRDSKNVLRGVSRAMCAQVEGSIGAVSSPQSGFSSDQLSHALATMARCPFLRELTLLNVSAHSGMQPLATASLTGATSLTMREAPRPGTAFVAWMNFRLNMAPGDAWGFPALSTGLAATLRVIDVGGCIGLTSIDVLRSCVQLRCLWMPGVFSVADLSPLEACSQLEELWMARHFNFTSLAPLKACPEFRKLDIRGREQEQA
ncbi:hypothetical protein FOA52_002674 [Chlamydomonas sp. UWO 241]|nr:hypothetical protein FOA52_002674 [Chlamydomonas sp. UWO 241]